MTEKKPPRRKDAEDRKEREEIEDANEGIDRTERLLRELLRADKPADK